MTTVARVNKKFGAEGEVMLSLFGDFPIDFNPETDALIALVDGLEVPLYCDTFERRGKSGALVKFSDLDTEYRVEEFIGKELMMELEEELNDDEFYMEDLIGFQVEANGVVGEITDFYDNDANPLLELQIKDKSVLVPAVEEFFAHIDFENQRVKLILPDGLLEL
ncbi:MAG: ribosome maturation factor RimM [Alistipes sp.]|nr:ribosome maturation factor RimM [Alistipes sp.]